MDARNNGMSGFAGDVLRTMAPGLPAEEDDPRGPGLPPSKNAEGALEIVDDDGHEWLIEYARRIPGRTGKAGVPLYQFRRTDGDKT